MKAVADASVTIAWMLADQPDEHLGELAVGFFRSFGSGEIKLLQPPHWIAEVAAVIARRVPEHIENRLTAIGALAVEKPASPTTLIKAAELAIKLNHHLFDTLYHAMALEHDATLVTADERYFAKARKLGSIELLQNFRPA